MISKGLHRDYFSLCLWHHIYLHSICFPILSLCSLIMLLCIFSVNCCFYYSRYLIVRKLSRPFPCLYRYAPCVRTGQRGGKCAGNKAETQVCTHIPVVLFSGAASANPHGKALQQNAIPKSKGAQNQKSSRTTGRPGKGC